MNENPFGITREEVLNLAAEKIANRESDDEYLQGLASNEIKKRIEALFVNMVGPRVDEMLTVEMERLLNTEIVPVTIWGEKAGPATTLRAAMSEKARLYWDTKVNSEGKPSDYHSCKPRSEWLISKITAEEFTKAIQQNLTNIIGAFKDSLKAEAAKTAERHIEELIRVKTK